MKRKSNLALVLFLLCTLISNAQEYFLHKYGPIKKDKKLAGYFFLTSEQKSRRIRQFTAELYDINMAPTSAITFTVEPDYHVDQVNFSATHIFVRLSKPASDDRAFGKFIFINIDEKRVQSSFDISPKDLSYYIGFTFPGNALVALKRDDLGRKFNHILEAVDFYNAVIWSYPVTDTAFEMCRAYMPYKFNDELLRVDVMKKGDKNEGWFEDTRLIEIQTGKQVAKIYTESDDLNFSPNKIHQNRDSTYIIVGSYKPIKGKHKEDPEKYEGKYFEKRDRNGKLLRQKKFAHSEMAGTPEVFFESGDKFKIVFGSNSILTMPGERLTDAIARDMTLIQMDKNFAIVNSSSLLEKKASGAGETVRLKSINVRYNKEINGIIIEGIAERNKKLGYSKDRFISLMYKEGLPLSSDEIELDEKATMTDFIEAKPGYVLIIEYFENEKKINKRLEKLSY